MACYMYIFIAQWLPRSYHTCLLLTSFNLDSKCLFLFWCTHVPCTLVWSKTYRQRQEMIMDGTVLRIILQLIKRTQTRRRENHWFIIRKMVQSLWKEGLDTYIMLWNSLCSETLPICEGIALAKSSLQCPHLFYLWICNHCPEKL